MFKVTATIVASVAALFMFAGMASADPIADQCARATIPTDLCNGTGGVVTVDTNSTVDNVKYVQKDKLFVGLHPDTGNPIFIKPEQAQPGQRDSDGNLVRDLSGYQYK